MQVLNALNALYMNEKIRSEDAFKGGLVHIYLIVNAFSDYDDSS